MRDLAEIINIQKIIEAGTDWRQNTPFPHLVIDGFFQDDIAEILQAEFPDFDDSRWHKYQNAIEIKKPPITEICSPR